MGKLASVLLNSISAVLAPLHAFHLGVMFDGSNLTLGSSATTKFMNDSENALSNAVLLNPGTPLAFWLRVALVCVSRVFE
jgi:hypothetical protein